MNEDEKQPAMRRRGIYLLPNLFTTGALFSGFYAIIAAMRGDFEPAAIAIFFCGKWRPNLMLFSMRLIST